MIGRKTVVSGLFLAASFMSINLLGQATEIELTRAVIQTQRQAIMAENMMLSEEEAEKFWPMYREYRGEMARLGDRVLKVIMTFADNYENLSEETAEWMVKEHLAVEKAEAELKTMWAPRFKEILDSKKLARFYQIENKLDAIIDFDLAESIPLIK
jgi:hypothetical protein